MQHEQFLDNYSNYYVIFFLFCFGLIVKREREIQKSYLCPKRGDKLYLQEKYFENATNKIMITLVQIVAIWVTILVYFFY